MTSHMAPDHRAYLERRYVDLKQIIEAVYNFYPPAAIDENHLIDTIHCEMNYLAEQLDLETVEDMLDRLIENDDA